MLPIFTMAAEGVEPLRVAVAASVQRPVREIADAFMSARSDCVVQVIPGSSGKLTAQILHGAPYDLFFSADTEYPQRLVDEGAAVGPVQVYAEGSLVLWSPGIDDFDMTASDDRVARIAIANPRVAPYGRAAIEVLESLGVMEIHADKLVYAENVAQAAHFVRSGAADAGFIPPALLPEGVGGISSRDVTLLDAHGPILHGYVKLAHSGHPCADAFAAFLNGQGFAHLEAYGLGAPPASIEAVAP